MNPKNLIKLVIVVLILLVVAGAGWFIFFRKTPPSHTAMLSGWLFEIGAPNETQRYLVRYDGTQQVLTEDEILKEVRSNTWIEPTEEWTPQQWAAECGKEENLAQPCSSDVDNFRGMPYEKYQTLMEKYLRDNKIDGSIKDSYVISIPRDSVE